MKYGSLVDSVTAIRDTNAEAAAETCETHLSVYLKEDRPAGISLNKRGEIIKKPAGRREA